MPEQGMTSLSPADAERLKLAFQRCREMEGTLNEQLQAYAAAGREIFPAYGEAVDRLVIRVNENGGGKNAPRPGEPMPPFVLPDEKGRLVALPSLLERGPVTVMFFRGHWCPYCRLNVRAVIKAYDRIRAQGADVVAIMPETQEYAAEFKTEEDAPFPVLTAMRCRSIWRSGLALRLSGFSLISTCRAFTATTVGCCRFQRPLWSGATAWSKRALSIPTSGAVWRLRICSPL
jgi:peroxiredoxin